MRIGLELEFTGISRYDVVKTIQSSLHCNISKRKAKNRYMIYEIDIPNSGCWLIKRDRSIKAQKRVASDIIDIEDSDNIYKAELVSPILDTSDLSMLFTLVSLIKLNGGLVNETCGVHIHVDKPSTLDEVVNMYNKFYSIQDDIIDRFKPYKNRLDKYTKRLVESDCNASFETLDEYLKYLHSILCPSSSFRRMRYFMLNFHSLRVRNTIEFRFFNSVLDNKVIQEYVNWVDNFCLSCKVPNKSKGYEDKQCC